MADEPLRLRGLRAAVALLALLAGTAAEGASPLKDPSTALSDYVRAPDRAYGFALRDSAKATGYTLYRLKLASQRWRSATEVDRPLWTHWLAVIVPSKVRFDTAFLSVAAGSSEGDPPQSDDRDIRAAAELAVATDSVAAVLLQVPNQPLVLADEPWPHAEDALVAYSWDKAMKTGDFGWPINLPMVKAVVRAMDAIQAFLSGSPGGPLSISGFVLHGESKRAAAVWLGAAADARVRAIAPAVFDFIDFPLQAEHHFQVYGFVSPAAQDYVRYQILQRLRTPEGEALARVVDPYSYRDRLDMPKLVIEATGDQFFPPDASRFYWDGLRGEKLLQAIPNVEHGLERPPVLLRARRHLIAWYVSILEGRSRPAIDWRVDDDGSLVVRASEPPLFATLWTATNLFSRDFRLDPLHALWLPWPAEKRDAHTFAARVRPPLFGWRAYFIQLGFSSPLAGYSQVYTTQVLITPDTFPNTISEPVGRLRDARSWLTELQAAQSGDPAARGISAKVERGLPMPVLGRRVSTPAQAITLLAGKGKSPERGALAECLAVRLNIVSGELGWYSRPKANGPYVWELWGEAHRAFRARDPRKSARICTSIDQP